MRDAPHVEAADAYYSERLRDFPLDWDVRFTLLRATVDGETLEITTTQEEQRTETTAVGLPLTQALNREATIAITYRMLVQRNSHLLTFPVAQPTNSVFYELDYTNTGISFVSVVPFFGSSRTPRIERSEPRENIARVSVGLDGWVLPRSGLAFVWVLADELMSRTRRRSSSAPDG